MAKTFLSSGVVLSVLIISGLLFHQATFASEPCGSIISLYRPTVIIDDCADPFEVNPADSTTVTLTIENNVVSDNDVVEVPIGGTDAISVSYPIQQNGAEHSFYLHDGDDYREINTSTLTTGIYTLVTRDYCLWVTQNTLQKIRAFFIPTAYACWSSESYVYTTTFEIIEVEPVPEIDALILQYAPILYFHEHEDYFPMDVESFVEASSLWSQDGIGDTQIHSSSSLTFETFEDLIDSGVDTSDYYLAFSDPDDDKSIDIDNAHVVYDNMRKTDTYATTTYYRRMVDGEYTVLQYWYFYAMNNWAERGGRNDHEGDWESVFIYLEKDTDEPKFVAYSSHLNDGENEALNFFQYDSVRREWNSDEVVKDDGQIVSFVAQGSHANYPSNNTGEHVVGSKIDKTSLNGTHLSVDVFSNIELEGVGWDQYQGKWGSDSLLSFGGDGPQGPRFIDVTGQLRFNSPIQWAGINRIQEQVIIDPVTTVPFENSNIVLEFSEPVLSGTSISVTPYYEPVTIGIVPSGATMLPGYYDFITSMDNGSFEVSMTLPYDSQYIESLGESPEDIRFGYYNESIDTWEVLPTVLDEQNHSVSTMRTGFSRYALMLVEQEEIIELKEETSTSQSTRTSKQGTRVDREPKREVLGASTSTTDIYRLVALTELLVQRYPQMTQEQKNTTLQILGEILILLKNHS